jgi:hypothetical protein
MRRDPRRTAWSTPAEDLVRAMGVLAEPSALDVGS